MVLESTMICVDSSDYMRNGDFVPTRLQAQQDAVNVLCHTKIRSNPENNVGILTMCGNEVLTALTADTGRLLSKLHQVQPKGSITFSTGIKIAHLALKHRQGKNHRMRIVAFVGSPVDEEEKDLIKLAKKLKKENVNVDVVNFGEENSQTNLDKLTAFVNTLNSKGSTSSNLVTVVSGGMLSDALIHSSIIAGEDGAGAPPGGMSGYEFGVDPNEDPELALALRVSMEEQRARQEKEVKDASKQTAHEATIPEEETAEEVMLKQALDMSMDQSDGDAAAKAAADADFATMTEEEQIAFAMQLSMQAGAELEAKGGPVPMETDTPDELDDVANDPDFLQSVLEGLPGVDTQSEAVRNAMDQLNKRSDGKSSDKKKPEDQDGSAL